MKLTRRYCPTCKEDVLFTGMVHRVCGYVVPVAKPGELRFGNALRKTKRRQPQKGRPRPPEWARR